MAETFHTPRYYVGSKVKVQYAEVTGQWNVMGKNVDSYGNALVTSTYGTQDVYKRQLQYQQDVWEL